MTDDDAGGMGVKWIFLDDVICERPLTCYSSLPFILCLFLPKIFIFDQFVA